MPLVRITARESRDDATLAALGGAIHDALVEAVGIPPDDRFQIHDRLRGAAVVADPAYLGVRRSDPVFVEITLRAGRSDAVKRALYARIAELAEERAGVQRADITIALRENGAVDWSFGDGIAHYAPG